MAEVPQQSWPLAYSPPQTGLRLQSGSFQQHISLLIHFIMGFLSHLQWLCDNMCLFSSCYLHTKHTKLHIREQIKSSSWGRRVKCVITVRKNMSPRKTHSLAIIHILGTNNTDTKSNKCAMWSMEKSCDTLPKSHPRRCDTTCLWFIKLVTLLDLHNSTYSRCADFINQISNIFSETYSSLWLTATTPTWLLVLTHTRYTVMFDLYLERL